LQQIESIYLDSGEPLVSTYTVLLERLALAEQALKVHNEMHVRMLRRHEQNVRDARAAFEAEGARLRAAIKVAK
jgi:hypothetical protein